MSDSPIEMAVNLTEIERKEAARDYPGASEFVHLHNHTLFSPLDGIATPEEYFSAAAHLGQPAFSITDHGSMANIPDAYFAGKANNVKFIPGCEVYFNQDHLRLEEYRSNPEWKIGLERPDYSKSEFTVEDLIKEEDVTDLRRNRHLTIMAINMLGYRNLIHMTSEAWEIGFYYKPRVWFQQIEKYHEGLIILSGCLNGPVCHNLRKAAYWKEIARGKLTEIKRTFNKQSRRIPLVINKKKALGRANRYQREAIKWIKKFSNLMGDRFYLEIQMPGEEIPFGKEAFKQVAALSKAMKIPAVVSNDCLTSNFKVLTKTRGYVNINQLFLDEEVLTHNNNYKRIVAMGSRGPKPGEKFYSLFESDMIATGNHKLFICRNDKIMQMPLNKIDQNDFLVVKKISLPEIGLSTLKFSDWIDDSRCTVKNGMIYPRGHAKNPIPNEIDLCDDLLWLIGYYIAEGYCDSYRLSFAHHKKEKEYYTKVYDYFSRFGFSPNYDEKCTGSLNGARTRICSSAFSILLKTICGHRAYAKKLPIFWNQLSAKQLKILLKGYLDGDGSYTKRKNRPGLFNVSYSTVSLELSLGLLKAFSALGIAPTLNYRKSRTTKVKNKHGKLIKTKCREAYTGNIKKYGCYLLGLIDNYKRSTPYKEIDGYLLIKNFFKKTDNIPERVYDIEVEDDHSFNIGFESTNCHYLQRKDFRVQKCMMAIDQGKTIDDPSVFHVDSDEQFFKSRAQLRKTFVEGGYDKFISLEQFEKFCDETVRLSERCEGFKPNLDPKLPAIPNADENLRKLVHKALKDKGLWEDKTQYKIDGEMVTYRSLAEKELNRYISKGFASYFLIIRDLVSHSQSKGWPVGPGRGSAGGSLVCYLLGIHDLDPIAWELSSVRFMGDSRGGFMLRVTMD